MLGLGYGRWPAFAYTSMVGIFVGEVQAATQPTDVVEDLRLYRAGQLEVHNRPRLGIGDGADPLARRWWRGADAALVTATRRLAW